MFDMLMAGAALGSGMLNAQAASDAAEEQSKATTAAIDEQRRQYELNRADSRPYINMGREGAARLSHLLGFGPKVSAGQTYQQIWGPVEQKYAQLGGGDFASLSPELRRQAYNEAEQAFAASQQGLGESDFGSLNKKFTMADFYNDPVTQASLEYGQKGIMNNLGAMGMRKSGLMLKGLTDYAGTKAAESSSRFYGDQDRIYNRIAGVTGSGQQATSNVAGMGANMANNVSNLTSAMGNARGAASIAKGNAWGNAFNNIGNWWNSNQQLNRLQNIGWGGAPTSNFAYPGWSPAGGNQYG